MTKPTTKIVIVFLSGLVTILLSSTVGWVAIPSIITSVFQQQAVIKKGNAVYDLWIEAPVPITMQFYFFHCNNSEQVLLGDKPQLEQKGPYTYREKRHKYVFSDEQGLLTYMEPQTFEPIPELSQPLDESITTINPIYTTLASKIADLPKIDLFKRQISKKMHNILEGFGERPFMTRTIRELIFDGWTIAPYVKWVNETLCKPDKPISQDLCQDLIGLDDGKEKFSFFYGRNGTNSSDTFTIESGANDLRKLGSVIKWKDEAQLNFWSNDTYCNMINGSDGSIYPPMTSRNDKIYIFNKDLCRSIYATYEMDIEEKGILGYRFTVPAAAMADPVTNPDNKCFCLYKDQSFCAQMMGVLDLRICQMGTPLIMSSPHFYQGSQKFIDDVIGLKPIKEEHQAHFDIEPVAGVPLFASNRIQINFDFQQYFVPQLSKLNRILFPVMWVNESARIDEASAQQFNSALSLAEGVNIGRWVFLSAGIVLVLTSIVMAIAHYKVSNKFV